MTEEIIHPNSKMTLKEIIESRYIIKQFALRDIKIRYINSYLGYLWAIFNPLFSALIYIIVFGLLVRISSPEYNTEYSVILLLGFLIWNLFLQTAEQSSNALLGNMHLIKKVYFPRFSLCLASTATSCIDFLLALFVTMTLLMIFSRNGFELASKRVLILPLLLIGLLSLAIAIGTFLSILKIKYQDIKHLTPLLFQSLFFASPIVYTQSLIPEKWSFLFQINPLYGYIITFRWIFIKNSPLDVPALFYSLIFSFILLFISIRFFSKNERQIVDSE